jgi:hypothetical protein
MVSASIRNSPGLNNEMLRIGWIDQYGDQDQGSPSAPHASGWQIPNPIKVTGVEFLNG